MKVYLLLADDGKPHFHFHYPRAERRDDPPPRGGLRGWLDRKSRALKASWTNADRGAKAKLRHLWERLHRRIPADEPMLVRLRGTMVIEVHHPAELSGDEARALWTVYLASCRRRHLPWLWINALCSPLTLVLAPLPGPNVVGYWFAYRAVRDLLVLLGLRHAQGGRVETMFHATAAPERALRHEQDAEMAVGSP